MLRRPHLLLLLTLSACRVGPLDGVGEDALRLTPAALEFSPVFVGASARLVLRVDNPSRARGRVTASITPPFSVSPPAAELAGGGSLELEVVFTPDAEGQVSAVLQVNGASVAVSGTGLAPLSCEPSTACAAVAFSAASGTCETTIATDGTSCETSCVQGQCVAGECIGALKNCPDTQCTVGVCSEQAGCSHVPRVCPAPTSPCQEAACDEASGCALSDKIDGTLCGVDDCRQGTVSVCISGACVERARPATGRCTNTWLPLNATTHEGAVAWDPSTGETLMLGSTERSTNTTWTWNGLRWTLRLPPATPPDRAQYRLATNTLRNTVLLFGGQGVNDTWEWDGRTWLERRAPASPPSRLHFAMAFDERRGRAVLFGGEIFLGGVANDTWEWDGRTWVERRPVNAPPARKAHAMAWDPVRERVLLFGGSTDNFEQQFADTWAWDGTDWVRVSSGGVSPRIMHGMTWDPIGRVMLAFGGNTGTSNDNSTIAWDGTNWSARATPMRPNHSASPVLTTDRVRNRALMLNEGVWEWDGTAWIPTSVQRYVGAAQPFFDPTTRQVTTMTYDGAWTRWNGVEWTRGATSPPLSREFNALGYDVARQRAVALSYYRDGGTETWESAGPSWSQQPVQGPSVSSRTVSQTAWDPMRQRVVLFGGADAGTWEWDGASWINFPQADGPAHRASNGLAFDSRRGRSVLFGGGNGLTPINDTWERVGTQWVLQPVSAAPQVQLPASLAFDPIRDRTVLVAASMNSRQSETWEWDGTAWSRLTPAVSPPPPTYSSPEYWGHLVFDPVSERVMLLRQNTLWRFEP
jgi:hypothetical protein